MSPAGRGRYSVVAILLHWSIAAALVLQVVLGWRLEDEEVFVRNRLLQLHKSIGILVLALTLGRLLWRFWGRPPPRNTLNRVEQALAHWVHIGLYVLLLALPLSGWALSSTRSVGTFHLFGFVPWPNLPFISSLSGSDEQTLSDNLGSVHPMIAWLMIGLIGLHISGALWHHFLLRDGTVSRMLPGIAPGSLGWRVLAVPGIGTLLVATGYLIQPSVPVPRPKPTNLEQADLFLDLVGPVLERRCGSCHSEDDARGGLSVTSYAGLMQGGRSAPSVVSGQPMASELLRRVSLPSEDVKFMPKNGRRPLTTSQILAIRLWIEMGASRIESVSSLHLSEDQRSTLRRLLGTGEAWEEPEASGETLPIVAKADSQAIKELVELGFVVRKISQSSELLAVDFASSGQIAAAAWSALERIAAQTRSLNLYNASVTDENMKVLSHFANLTQLRLESNPIGDDGAACLMSLRTLVSLNLVNTKVGDAGVAMLGTLPALRRLYVWRSSVSPAKIATLRQDRPDVEVIAGLAASDIEVEKPSAGAPN
jgi:cytochrome b561